MTSNKLSYLSKYMDPNEESDRKKKKSKKKKDKKSDVVRLKDIDDEVGIPAYENVIVADQDDEVEGEDDAPVVIDNPDIGHSMEHHAVDKGKWDVEDIPTASKTRRRHDSSSDDESERSRTKDKASSRRSHDSDARQERSNRRHDRSHSRRRFDSNRSDEEPARQRRRRHDSEDEEDEKEGLSSKNTNVTRSRRHDSDDFDKESEKMRRRHDSDESSAPAVRKRRCDSSPSSEDEKFDLKQSRRRRHDSSESVSDDQSKKRMSSGHAAGIQTAGDFSKKESRIQLKRREEAQQTVDKYGVGETVYRDKASGKKVDEPALRERGKLPKQLSAKEQHLLNTGRAQLELEERQRLEFAALQESSFARHKDDSELEDWRKNEIRADDPMAAYAVKKKRADGSNVPQRPVYKGPPPKPNRYGIPPGHRWDAKDRGNGFEDKLLAKQFNAQHQREKAYRYSSADM